MPLSTSSTDRRTDRRVDGSSCSGAGPGRGVELLEIGRIVRPHGIRGAVVVHLVTNRLERLAPGSLLSSSGGCAEPRRAPAVLEVVESRPHQGRYIVRFAGVSSIDAAETLRDVVLSAPPLDDPDALFVHELIGRRVVDATGADRGTVVSVQANPASDLLVLDRGGLVPLRFVVGRSGDEILVDAPDGLFG